MTAATLRRSTGTSNGLPVYAADVYRPRKRCSPIDVAVRVVALDPT